MCIFAGYRMQQDHSCIVVAKIHQHIHEAYEQKIRSCSGLALWCLQSCSIFFEYMKMTPPYSTTLHDWHAWACCFAIVTTRTAKFVRSELPLFPSVHAKPTNEDSERNAGQAKRGQWIHWCCWTDAVGSSK